MSFKSPPLEEKRSCLFLCSPSVYTIKYPESKKPIIKNYPTISLNELTKKNFKIENIVNKLKKIYEIFLKDIYSAKLINFKKISNKYII